jgi:hypothetical protein
MKGMDGLHNFVTRKCKNKEEGSGERKHIVLMLNNI